MAKREKRVMVDERVGRLDTDELEGPIDEAIARLVAIKAEHPDEDIFLRASGYSDEMGNFEIRRRRPETRSERATRLGQREAYQLRVREKELAELAALKAKYES